jgi:peptidoglycan/LPS O-acetylase OafA/YrhL
MNSESKSIRIVELDALRGIAALAVVFYHYTMQTSLVPENRVPVSFTFPWGDLGVPLFFMISGFVIIMTFDRVMTVKDFLLGRFSRLYPAYWACLLFTFVAVALFGLPSHRIGLKDLLWNLTMMPHLLARAQLADGDYWTLECELLFYGAMALLFKTGALKRVKTVMFLWMLLAAAVVWVINHHEAGSLPFKLAGKVQTVGVLPFIHFFSMGVVFYDLRRQQKWTLGHVLVLGLAVASSLWLDPLPHGWIVLGLASICFAATAGYLPFLKWAPLTFLGGISYPLYLLHQSIGHIALKAMAELHWPPLVAFVVTVSGVILLAYLTSVWVERPAMRWIRDHLRSRRSAPPPSVLVATSQ